MVKGDTAEQAAREVGRQTPAQLSWPLRGLSPAIINRSVSPNLSFSLPVSLRSNLGWALHGFNLITTRVRSHRGRALAGARSTSCAWASVRSLRSRRTRRQLAWWSRADELHARACAGAFAPTPLVAG